MSAVLEKEFNYYLHNKKDILRKYRNKYVVIHDRSVDGAYDTRGDALFFSSKKYPVGTFLIHHVTPEERVQKFHSRVYVS